MSTNVNVIVYGLSRGSIVLFGHIVISLNVGLEANDRQQPIFWNVFTGLGKGNGFEAGGARVFIPGLDRNRIWCGTTPGIS